MRHRQTYSSGAFDGPPNIAFSAQPPNVFGVNAPSADDPASSAFGAFEYLSAIGVRDGLDHHHLGVPIEIHADAEQRGIVASKTPLDWIVNGSDGPMPHWHTQVLKVTVRYAEDADDRYAQLHQLVNSHFSTESFGVKASDVIAESDNTKRARKTLLQTTRRVSDDRFKVGLLWRTDETRLLSSYDMTLRRLLSVEARMQRDAAYLEQQCAYRGVRQQGLREAAQRRGGVIGWSAALVFAALRSFQCKKAGKFRLVFDDAATVGDVSLNWLLLSGPVCSLLQPLALSGV